MTDVKAVDLSKDDEVVDDEVPGDIENPALPNCLDEAVALIIRFDLTLVDETAITDDKMALPLLVVEGKTTVSSEGVGDEAEILDDVGNLETLEDPIDEDKEIEVLGDVDCPEMLNHELNNTTEDGVEVEFRLLVAGVENAGLADVDATTIVTVVNLLTVRVLASSLLLVDNVSGSLTLLVPVNTDVLVDTVDSLLLNEEELIPVAVLAENTLELGTGTGGDNEGPALEDAESFE